VTLEITLLGFQSVVASYNKTLIYLVGLLCFNSLNVFTCFEKVSWKPGVHTSPQLCTILKAPPLSPDRNPHFPFQEILQKCIVPYTFFKIPKFEMGKEPHWGSSWILAPGEGHPKACWEPLTRHENPRRASMGFLTIYWSTLVAWTLII
jgi:hypothetical protein